ncbi:MAG TPA: methyltransferase domain-containing protein [Solirubrobacteraceae bacterium]|nr:methyltransferase domain-containing protein [Solirubrobacteraceae bacterium]
MDPPATTWGVGDYPLMAQRLEGAARAAVDLAEVGVYDHVLDVACGTGNAALLAAAAGATVTGVDFEPSLLDRARERADSRGLSVTWVHGDAGALPFPDGRFSVVLSVFGVMYAPDQARAAGELARVCSSGGRVVLAAWSPGSLMPAIGAAMAPYLPPPPPGSSPPAVWGDQQAEAALLGGAGLGIDGLSHQSLALGFSDRDAAVDLVVRTAGHVLAERERLSRTGHWSSLLENLAALVDQRDEGVGAGVSLRMDYLLTIASPK